MVKDHSFRGNRLPSHQPTDRIMHTAENWLKQETAYWVQHNESIHWFRTMNKAICSSMVERLLTVWWVVRLITYGRIIEHHPTDRITHTTAFVTPVVEHWLEREIAQWVHSVKDRSDDPPHHERRLYLWATSCSSNQKEERLKELTNRTDWVERYSSRQQRWSLLHWTV